MRAANLHGISLNDALEDGLERSVGSTLPLTYFTPRVETTLRRAFEIAQSFHHDHLGTEHLLLALIEDGGGIAGQVLHDLAGDTVVRERLLDIIRSPQYSTSTTSTTQISGGLQ